MSRADGGDPPTPPRPASDTEADLALQATAPVRWLLHAASEGGVGLTQTNALARAVVREAAERWPHWWDADLFGPPHREADMAVLESLHEGLRRLRLIRRRGRKLHTTVRGRELAADPIALLNALASDIGGGDSFTEVVAGEIVDRLAIGEPCRHDDLVKPALAAAWRGGWVDPAGNAPDQREVSWVVGEVLRRGEAYGLIERRPEPGEARRWRSLISLSTAARIGLSLPQTETLPIGATFVFEARLVGARGVSASVAVGAHEHLTALHEAVQQAFGWADDHLYSFWLDGEFWGDDTAEFVRPDAPDTEQQTADIPLAELALSDGAKLAYVFDYGDEWRVMLTLKARVDQAAGAYPRVIERRGTAPPQYPPLDEV